MNNDNNYVVYKHTSPSNKVYIGITSQSPNRRWGNGNGYKAQAYFWNAIQKYGWDNIKHEIIFDNLTKEEAEQKEIELIASYKSNDVNYGYNMSIGGESGSKGYRYSDEQKKHMSYVHKGEKNGMYGKQHTKISKEKNRIKHLKENLSPDTILKMSAAKKGKKRDRCSVEKQIETISKKVVCIEKMIVYKSVKKASALTGIDSSCISKVCRGKRKTAGGFHWSYLDDLYKINTQMLQYKEVS